MIAPVWHLWGGRAVPHHHHTHHQHAASNSVGPLPPVLALERGMAIDVDGSPSYSKKDDPCYQRGTSFTISGKAIDAARVPYYVLTSSFAHRHGIRGLDLAAVYSAANNRLAFAIYADNGPHALQEGSIFLAQQLGFTHANPRNGSATGQFLWAVFPRSAARGGHLHLDGLATIGRALAQEHAADLRAQLTNYPRSIASGFMGALGI